MQDLQRQESRARVENPRGHGHSGYERRAENNDARSGRSTGEQELMVFENLEICLSL